MSIEAVLQKKSQYILCTVSFYHTLFTIPLFSAPPSFSARYSPALYYCTVIPLSEFWMVAPFKMSRTVYLNMVASEYSSNLRGAQGEEESARYIIVIYIKEAQLGVYSL